MSARVHVCVRVQVRVFLCVGVWCVVGGKTTKVTVIMQAGSA
jgi:hypothetical protein